MKKLVFLIAMTWLQVVSALPAEQPQLARLDSSSGFSPLYPSSRVPYPQIDPMQVVNIFLEAVDEGQLVVFETLVTRDMILPVSVEYTYLLDRSQPQVKVSVKLLQPMALPEIPELIVSSVTAVLDRDGDIEQVIVHCGA